MLRNGQFIKENWSKIVVGEIIKLENDDFVAVNSPATGSSFSETGF